LKSFLGGVREIPMLIPELFDDLRYYFSLLVVWIGAGEWVIYGLFPKVPRRFTLGLNIK
jgi:hypothetical protein